MRIKYSTSNRMLALMYRRRNLCVGIVVASALFGGYDLASAVDFSAEAAPTRKQAQTQLDSYLKNSDLAVSRCMLPPIVLPDGVTVAISDGMLFEPGDILKTVNGVALDSTAPRPLLAVLMKIPPQSSIPVAFKRRGTTRTVTAACKDAKAYYDLVIEGAYGGAHNDFTTCATKLQAAASIHVLQWTERSLRWNCQKQIGQITAESMPLSFYEIEQQRIAQARYSVNELEAMRGPILNASDWLKSHNAESLSADLKKLLEDATAEAKADRH
jgi:hypothetical protein